MDFRRPVPTAVSQTDPSAAPLAPFVKFTAQRFFFLGNKFKTSVGTQPGTTPWRLSSQARATHFTYNIWIYEPRPHVKVVAAHTYPTGEPLGRSTQSGCSWASRCRSAKSSCSWATSFLARTLPMYRLSTLTSWLPNGYSFALAACYPIQTVATIPELSLS
ncbi:hypothetical protein SAMN06269250_0682 [Spirosoma fluviale]|uniref:Uncharacterized protein n=1 Tax=Spirosoma fluviale TaxID=1597977 RepID=A0A286F794_9BACT|nr:hypothetical protein SAMN06269250_0682 [Spirosoma fluviale]